MIQACVILFACSCFASFTWSIRRFFARRGALGTGMRSVQGFGLPFMLLHLVAVVFLFDGSPTWAFVAVAIYGCSLLVFWWALLTVRARPLTLAFSADSPEHLVVTGPFRWIRHPFYASYSLAWVAGVVATRAWWLLPSVGVMCWLYWRAATLEEQKFATTTLAAQYEAYASRAGMFWPRLKALRGCHARRPECLTQLPTQLNNISVFRDL